MASQLIQDNLALQQYRGHVYRKKKLIMESNCKFNAGVIKKSTWDKEPFDWFLVESSKHKNTTEFLRDEF